MTRVSLSRRRLLRLTVYAAPAAVALELGGARRALALSPPSGSWLCPRSAGYWRHHEEEWPVDRLALGHQEYDKAELLALLSPGQSDGAEEGEQGGGHQGGDGTGEHGGDGTGGHDGEGERRGDRPADASLLLARQLVAAKLNLAGGSDPAPVALAVEGADRLLGEFEGRLPYRVRPRSSRGQEMLEVAEQLAEYNESSPPYCLDE